MKTALLFPGQGSQAPRMRETVEHHRPDLLELALEEVGEDPFERLGDSTAFDQPAIYCASLAGFEMLGRPKALFYAGHSLGEVAALTAAGALTDVDGLRLVAARGRLTERAARQDGKGGMLVVRADGEEVAAIAERHGVVVANYNAPRQVVLSGPSAALDAAAREFEEVGVRAKRLPIAGAFHSPAMAAAARSFAEVLQTVTFAEPRVPVMSCVNAAPFGDPRTLLAAAITSPVRWLDVVHALAARGVRRFVETGPGHVLAGLVRRSLDGIDVTSADSLEVAGA